MFELACVIYSLSLSLSLSLSIYLSIFHFSVSPSFSLTLSHHSSQLTALDPESSILPTQVAQLPPDQSLHTLGVASLTPDQLTAHAHAVAPLDFDPGESLHALGTYD